jgi:hypothetical protein
MSGREAIYGLLAVLGLVVPWYFNFQYAAQGGNLGDLVGFFSMGFVNPVASSLTLDLTIAFAAFVLWAIPESRRIGMRAGWLYPLLGFFIAFAFAFPLFLLMRERHLRASAHKT